MGRLIGEMATAGILIAGCAMVRLASMKEASVWAKKFLALVGEGESEIRLMHGQPSFS